MGLLHLPVKLKAPSCLQLLSLKPCHVRGCPWALQDSKVQGWVLLAPGKVYAGQNQQVTQAHSGGLG